MQLIVPINSRKYVFLRNDCHLLLCDTTGGEPFPFTAVYALET